MMNIPATLVFNFNLYEPVYFQFYDFEYECYLSYILVKKVSTLKLNFSKYPCCLSLQSILSDTSLIKLLINAYILAA